MLIIDNSAGTLEFDALTLKISEKTKSAERPVPKRSSGDVLDTGTWTHEIINVRFSCRLDDSEADTMEAIFNQHERTALELYSETVPMFSLSGWFRSCNIVWESVNYEKPWLAHVTFQADTMETFNPITDLKIQLREHKYYSAYTPQVTFSKVESTWLRTTDISPCRGYNFVVFPASFLNGKKLHVKWRGVFENAGGGSGSWKLWGIYVYDGSYDRSNDSDFPTGSFLTKGNGLIQTVYEKTVSGSGCPLPWGPETITQSLSFTASQEYVTLFFICYDAWLGQYVTMDIDFIEVLDAFDNVHASQYMDGSIHMEKTGSQGDYGHIGENDYT